MSQGLLAHEAVLDEVRARMGTLDAKAEQAVREAVAILARNHMPEPQLQNEPFRSVNVSVAQYEAWSSEERFQYLNEAEQFNQRWVEKQLHDLRAAWLMVIDGEVIAHGKTIHTLPQENEFEALCARSEKYPFVFFNPRLFMIEESTAWVQTSEPDDFYPTLALCLRGAHNEATLVADFDTGAMDAFFDFDVLSEHRLVTVGARDYERQSVHLGKSFRFLTKPLWFSLKDENGNSQEAAGFAFCIKDWHNSPFVAINSNRSALIGRSLLLQIAPLIHLDFASKQTLVEIPASHE